MVQKMLAVRGVNENVYRKFREKVVAEKTNVGKALTMIMKKWIEEEKMEKLDPKNILKIKGIIKTREKVRWSKEIDEIVYS